MLDAPDFQKTVVVNSTPSNAMPGPDAPDWQETVQVVPSPEKDAPDWQVVAVGPGGAPIGGGAGAFEQEVLAIVEAVGLGSLWPSWYMLTECSGASGFSDNQSNDFGLYGGGLPTFRQPTIVPGSIFLSTELVPGNSLYGANTNAAVGIANYTMMIAFKATVAAGTPQGLCGLMDRFPGNGTRASMFLDANGYLNGGQDKAGGAFSKVTGSTDLCDGNAHLVAQTFDSNTGLLIVYEDGTSIGTVAPGTIPSDLCYEFFGYGVTAGTGGVGSPWGFTGYLQHFLCWEAAVLTAAQIASLYTASGL
jgi:hypothetical protein